MTTAAVPRTATPYGPDLIARGLFVDVNGKELCQRFLNGTATVRDILSALGPHVGIWWGVMGEYGDLVDFEDHAFTSPDTLLAENIQPEENWWDGNVEVVLVAKRPTRNGEPWDPEKHNPIDPLMGNSYLEDGEQVDLVEIRYNAGKGWHSIPAGGIRVQAAMAGPIYRGIVADLTPEQVELRQKGDWQALANSVMEAISAEGASHGWHGGGVPSSLGMYWSRSLEVATRFTGHPVPAHLMSVVIEARYDDTAPRGHQTGFGWKGEDEQEQTLNPGTQVEVDALRMRVTVDQWVRVIMNGRRAQAGANGDLPEGIEFEIEGRPTYTGSVSAYLPGVGNIGVLKWWAGDQTPIVDNLWVADEYRRRGVATALLAEARKIIPDLQHSQRLSPDGRAWSQTTAKVRDLPDVWYHGASERRAQQTSQSGFPDDYRPTNGELGPGIYLTTSPKTGNLYGDLVTRSGRPGAVMQLKARFDRPYVSPDGAVVDNVNREFGTKFKTGKEVNAFLRERGYDALIVHFMNETWAVAFNPANISYVSHAPSVDRKQFGKAAALDPVALEHWRPTAGMFAPGMKTLDPRIFDLRTEQMLPAVRQAVLGRLDAYWTPMFGHWQDWARVYLAGSGASYWWDSDTDLDLMVGVDLDRLRMVRPANKDVADDEIVAHLNKTLMDLRPSMAAMVFEPGAKPMDVTYFVNAGGAYDVRTIHPYAAYSLDDDAWVVHPPVLPANWGPDSIPEETWRRCEQAAREAEEVLSLPEPERTAAGIVLFNWVHEGRRAAYSGYGGGWLDPGNVIYQFLSLHPLHLLRGLYLCKHPEQASTAEAAERLASLREEMQDLRGREATLGLPLREGEIPGRLSQVQVQKASRSDRGPAEAHRDEGVLEVRRDQARERVQGTAVPSLFPPVASGAWSADSYPGEESLRLPEAQVRHHAGGLQPDAGRAGRPLRDVSTGTGGRQASAHRPLPRDEQGPGSAVSSVQRDDRSRGGRSAGGAEAGAGDGAVPDARRHGGLKHPEEATAADAIEKTAGASGGLPEGLTFEDGGPGELPEAWPYRCGSGEHEVRAILNGKVIGQIRWATQVNPSAGVSPGYITFAGVQGEYQRRGIASAMLARAREVDPRVHHSPHLTGDGAAWSQAVGSKTGEITYSHSIQNRNVAGVGPLDCHVIEANTDGGTGGNVGRLVWVDGEIVNVRVHDTYRRKGVATEMLKRAREITPDLHHSEDLSPEGRAWARAVGSKTAAKTYYHGSSHEFAPGEMLLPVSQTGAKNWAEQMGLDSSDPSIIGPHYSKDRIYLTTDRIKAMDFGRSVYEVEPTGPVEADPEAMGEPWFYSEAPAKVVKKVIENNRSVGAKTAAGMVPQELVDQFLESHIDVVTDPDEARDRCVDISEAFADLLRQHNIPAEVISGAQFGEHPMFPGQRLLLNGHFAVLTNGQVYDWTARQFDPNAEVPSISAEEVWRDTWSKFGSKTAATGGTIWRGLRLPVTDEVRGLAKSYWDESEVPERRSAKIGNIFLDMMEQHIGRHSGPGLGIHWSTRPEMADVAAETSGQRQDWPVVVEATYRPEDVVPEGDDLYGMSAVWQGNGIEAEVLIKPGARLTVTGLWLAEEFAGINIFSVDDCPKMNIRGTNYRNVLTSPQQRTASTGQKTAMANDFDQDGDEDAIGPLWQRWNGYSPQTQQRIINTIEDVQSGRKRPEPKQRELRGYYSVDLDGRSEPERLLFAPVGGQWDAVMFLKQHQYAEAERVLPGWERSTDYRRYFGAAQEPSTHDIRLVLLDTQDPEMAAGQLAEHLDTVNGLDQPKQALVYPTQRRTLGEWDRNLMHNLTKDHGFTLHDHPGDGPANGFMVSIDKDSEESMPLTDASPQCISDYMSVHQQELRDPNNYLGGWVFKGNVFLDISRHVGDEEQALKLARANHQIGIYDLRSGQTILTNGH